MLLKWEDLGIFWRVAIGYSQVKDERRTARSTMPAMECSIVVALLVPFSTLSKYISQDFSEQMIHSQRGPREWTQ